MLSFIKRASNRAIHEIAWIICYFFPIHANRILVSNFQGKGYADSPKYIVEELRHYSNLDIIWVLQDEKVPIPEGIKSCKISSIKYIYYISTAKIWLDNSRKYKFFRKKTNQFYIQTWHGFPLKRIEKDVLDTLNAGYEKIAIKDAKATDVMISDSKFMTDIYRSAFWYNGTIKEFGLPRYDILRKPDTSIKEKVFSYYKLDASERIVLYAPTFRQNGSLSEYNIDPENVLAACKNRFGHDYVLLIRLHPNISNKNMGLKYNEKIINATDYPDLQELLLSTDIVISDYSSLMFDFALTSRPCFMFATDIKKYLSERGFYFDIKNLPFPLADDNQSLYDNIVNFDSDLYTLKMKSFFDDTGMVISASSSRKCAEIIMEQINPATIERLR